MMGSIEDPDPQQPWQGIAHEKRLSQLRAMEDSPYVPNGELILAEPDARVLGKMIATGRYTSEAVTRAYISRAIDVHLKVRCIISPIPFQSSAICVAYANYGTITSRTGKNRTSKYPQ